MLHNVLYDAYSKPPILDRGDLSIMRPNLIRDENGSAVTLKATTTF
jgi:hypothetical protein